MVNIKRILEFFVNYEETAVNTDSLEMHSNENQRFPTALTFWGESLDFIIWIPENSKLPYLRIPEKGVKSLDLWIPNSLDFVLPEYCNDDEHDVCKQTADIIYLYKNWTLKVRLVCKRSEHISYVFCYSKL